MSSASFIVLLSLLLPLGVIAIVFAFVAFVVYTRGKGHKKDRLDADETRMIQEIHSQLSRMEERIEALETIVIDRDRKEVPR